MSKKPGFLMFEALLALALVAFALTQLGRTLLRQAERSRFNSQALSNWQHLQRQAWQKLLELSNKPSNTEGKTEATPKPPKLLWPQPEVGQEEMPNVNMELVPIATASKLANYEKRLQMAKISLDGQAGNAPTLWAIVPKIADAKEK